MSEHSAENDVPRWRCRYCGNPLGDAFDSDDHACPTPTGYCSPCMEGEGLGLTHTCDTPPAKGRES